MDVSSQITLQMGLIFGGFVGLNLDFMFANVLLNILTFAELSKLIKNQTF